VRIEGNPVVIEYDANNKPLIEMLISAGIPREQIVLAYAGETLETA
jgi:vancomycin permeability regulator SanA